MSVNVKCNLPPGTRIKDVAKVSAALLGHVSRHEPIGGSTATFAHVDGWKLSSSGSDVTIAFIVLDTLTDNPAAKSINNSDGDKYHLMYHFEGKRGGPGIYPASTAAKIALCAGLVNFFGGTVDFNDCDDKDVDLRVKAKPDINAEDDPEWSTFQQRILEVKPITEEDIAKYSRVAGY